MENSREQFEKFYESRFKHLPNDPYKGVFWSFWKASRESLEVELPDASDSDSGSPNYHDGYNAAMGRAYDELIKNGVKVK